jgi:dihydrofolate reductase
MRKLIICNIVSLDGYYTGPNNNVMVMPMGGVFDIYNASRLHEASTLLVGRVSFEMFRDFWPPVADDPNWDDKNREISRLNNAIDKVVISDTLTNDQRGAWASTTRIVKRSDAHQEIAKLKAQDGKDILVFGSHMLWNALLANGLVDELHLMIGNIVLGDGVRAFENKPNFTLRLIDAVKWEGANNVVLQYAVEYQ